MTADVRAKRRSAVALGALLAALMLPTAAACGIQPTGITVLGQAPAAVGAAVQPSQAFGSSGQFPVFFYLNDRLTPLYLPAKADTTEQDVLDALLNGPSKTAAAKGFVSALPATLTASIQADGLRYAYKLNLPLTAHAKAQFVCTMQYYDQTLSVGLQVGDSSMTWLGCSDTTGQYIPMPVTGDFSVPAATNSGQ
ncbi:hypothetical protein KGA66_01775 [Actinocrinis puniceicyclus]|uniref:Lipoprotein n=1 Tax=Actinocrinis puniceicyclus TaxID=977794 RepID=A0A8J7WLM9_9ACTN|nr:hypothetical protein [Actinocrinis puniceicyclus]MBS2961759.1 hypothetical protein [Actinocrinis puniceicyclus]